MLTLQYLLIFSAFYFKFHHKKISTTLNNFSVVLINKYLIKVKSYYINYFIIFIILKFIYSSILLLIKQLLFKISSLIITLINDILKSIIFLRIDLQKYFL